MIKIQKIIFASVVSLALCVSLVPSSVVSAGSNNDIISDAVFGNEFSMSESQINNFINSFPNSCLRSQNYPAGLSPVTFDEPIDYSNYGGGVSPARVIYKAATIFHLNPQVILATLEKEQNLVSGNAGCPVWKYNSAMGYNCPDGSENSLNDYPNIGVYDTCVKKESNVTFSRQVNHASWQLRFDKERAYGNTGWGGDGAVRYVGFMTEGNRARYEGGPVQYYDGYAIIDGQALKLANGATAALYNYTPHINNFGRIFSSWFGATHILPIPGCNEATHTSLVCVWKAKNGASGSELITESYDAINSYVNGLGYGYLGKAFIARSPSARGVNNIPIYSVTMPAGYTFLTPDQNEYQYLVSLGYQNNNIAFYADPVGANTGYPVYRLYSSTAQRHVWTIFGSEVEMYKSVGYTLEGTAFTSLSPYAQEAAPPAGQSLVYRFGNMPGNTHFWTQDLFERDNMIAAGYSYEGVAWRVTKSQTSMPIHRLYSSGLRRHLYTNDWAEVYKLVDSKMWQLEGTAWYGSSNSGAPIYRLYSPGNQEHLYTGDDNEVNFWVSRGLFYNEGISWRQP